MGMDQRSVRVVVGQGDRARGSLSDALTDDGFLVVGEAATIGDLARVLRDAEPDVIVLDDSIGVAAAQLATELTPQAKLVVIWPAAVMPIAGAARVDPSEVGMALSATVGLVAGISGLGSIERPEWIEKVRKDPAALRAKLAASGAAPVRPSVTELQRRGQRLHPNPGASRRRTPRSARAAAAAGAVSLASTDATAGEGAAPAGPTAGETDALVSRRIGMIALGGAAVAGALMIALSFGPNRSPSVITAVRFIPPITTPTAGPPTTTDPTPDDGGQHPGQSPGPTTPPPTDGGTTTTSPSTPTSPPTTTPPAGGAGGPGGGGTGGGTGGGGTGGSGTRNALAAVAGSSTDHNPHGGAPGLKDSGSAAKNPHGGPPGLTNGTGGGQGPNGSHAGGHTPHGDHPAHPVHSHKR